MTSRNTVLVDLDNTLFDATWRKHFLADKTDKQRWAKFHQECVHDQPNADIKLLIQALFKCGWSIIGLTGRNEKYRAMTLHVLFKCNVPMHELLMRPDDDYQPSPECKFGLAVAWFGGQEELMKAHVGLVLDDRDDVLAKFRAVGITTMLVNCQPNRLKGEGTMT